MIVVFLLRLPEMFIRQKSGQILRRFKESKLLIGKIIEECIKNAFIACGIVDKHGFPRCFNSVFCFLPDFSV